MRLVWWWWLGGRGCSAQDLVLGGQAIELAPQALVVCEQVCRLRFDGFELELEVFDVPLLALAEGSLAGGAVGQRRPSSQALGLDLRCSVLCLSPS